jgi:hypothetical protein
LNHTNSSSEALSSHQFLCLFTTFTAYLPIRCLFTAYSLPIHCLFTLFIVFSSSTHLFLVYSSFIPRLLINSSFMVVYLSIHRVFIICSSSINRLFIVYSSSIHRLFIIYSSSIHSLFIVYSSSIRRLFIRRPFIVYSSPSQKNPKTLAIWENLTKPSKQPKPNPCSLPLQFPDAAQPKMHSVEIEPTPPKRLAPEASALTSVKSAQLKKGNRV